MDVVETIGLTRRFGDIVAVDAVSLRDLGLIHKLFVSPTPRAALVIGKALSAGVRSLSQVVIVYTLAVLLGVRMNWHPLALAGVVVAVLEVDALRALMIAGGGSVFGVGTDFVVLISSTAILVAIATRVYPRVVT